VSQATTEKNQEAEARTQETPSFVRQVALCKHRFKSC